METSLYHNKVFIFSLPLGFFLNVGDGDQSLAGARSEPVGMAWVMVDIINLIESEIT